MEGGGTLFFRDDGGYVYFEGRKTDFSDGLYKIMILGLQGKKDLGTMLPVDGGLKLTRMVSRQTLAQWGCLPVLQVICEKVYGFSGGKTTEIGKNSSKLEEESVKLEKAAEWVYLEEEQEDWVAVEGGFSLMEFPEKGIADKELKETFSLCTGVLRENLEDGFVLAVPFSVNGTFPVMSLFCFARLERLEEGTFLLFYFGKDGKVKFSS